MKILWLGWAFLILPPSARADVSDSGELLIGEQAVATHRDFLREALRAAMDDSLPRLGRALGRFGSLGHRSPPRSRRVSLALRLVPYPR